MVLGKSDQYTNKKVLRTMMESETNVCSQLYLKMSSFNTTGILQISRIIRRPTEELHFCQIKFQISQTQI